MTFLFCLCVVQIPSLATSIRKLAEMEEPLARVLSRTEVMDSR